MARVSCPKCRKSYQVPTSAMGRTATCKDCGKRFRLGPGARSASETQSTGTKSASQPSDEIGLKADQPEPDHKHPRVVDTSVADLMAAAEEKLESPKGKKVRWGFQWGKVGLGVAMTLLAGGAFVGLVILTQRIDRLTMTLGAISFCGLFVIISGLMGEEGIW